MFDHLVYLLEPKTKKIIVNGRYYDMNKVLKKDQILTIPNFLSLIRILLIPLIIWLYCTDEYRMISVAVIILSGLTDIADGIIARKFHMVSDFGKMLDPIADKMTQGAILLCLAIHNIWILILTVLFIIKEICMAVFGYIALRKNSVNSARWYGKANTVVLYVVLVLLILFPGMPEWIGRGLICVSGGMMILSLTLYARFYYKILRKNPK